MPRYPVISDDMQTFQLPDSDDRTELVTCACGYLMESLEDVTRLRGQWVCEECKPERRLCNGR